jgi:hypothetical protein
MGTSHTPSDTPWNTVTATHSQASYTKNGINTQISQVRRPSPLFPKHSWANGNKTRHGDTLKESRTLNTLTQPATNNHNRKSSPLLYGFTVPYTSHRQTPTIKTQKHHALLTGSRSPSPSHIPPKSEFLETPGSEPPHLRLLTWRQLRSILVRKREPSSPSAQRSFAKPLGASLTPLRRGSDSGREHGPRGFWEM